MRYKTWLVSASVLVLLGGVGWFLLRDRKEPVKWRTAKAERGNVTQRISATGALNALIQVPVGTQVSGVVVSLSADFNSLVKKGQVIAEIDPTTWLSNLKDAEAGVQRAQDTLANAQVDYKRNKELWANKLLSDSDLDVKQLALQIATGNLESAKATLANAKTNLGYCTITAPVDGVVVSRLVDVGQTVAASFNTPNVFTIAQDLSRMKVQAAIDEADIGQVRVGQKAYFTVDSYPEKQFRGMVSEVQLNPVITNNVVTYNVVMEVANEPRSGAAPAKVEGLEYTTARYIPKGAPVYQGNLALFPGMTANCTIITNRKDDVLRVPSSALRFNPATFLPAEEAKAGSGGGQGTRASGPSGTATGAGGPSGSGGQGGGTNLARGMVAHRNDQVWEWVNGKPKAIPVQLGISDGTFTEITGGDLHEGMVVITGVEDYKKALSQGAPPLGGGMRR